MLSLAACECDPSVLDGLQYACATDNDCIAGRACRLGVCVDPNAFDGGTGGGDATGGGSTGGGDATGGGSTGGGSTGGGSTGGGSTGGGYSTGGGSMGGGSAGGDSTGGGSAGGGSTGGGSTGGGSTGGGSATGGSTGGGSTGGGSTGGGSAGGGSTGGGSTGGGSTGGGSSTVTFRAASNAKISAGTLAIPVPVGTTEGDVMLALVTVDNRTTTIVPNASTWNFVDHGGTLVGDGQSGGVWWKRAALVEPPTYSFNGGNNHMAGILLTYAGVDPVDPLDSYASAFATIAFPVPYVASFPIVRASFDGSRQVMLVVPDVPSVGMVTFGSVFGFTTRSDTMAVDWSHAYAADRALNAGDTAVFDQSITGPTGGHTYFGWNVVLRPAAATSLTRGPAWVQKFATRSLGPSAGLQVALSAQATSGNLLVAVIAAPSPVNPQFVSTLSWTQRAVTTSGGPYVAVFTAPVTASTASFFISAPTSDGGVSTRLTALGGEMNGVDPSVLDGAPVAAAGTSNLASLSAGSVNSNTFILTAAAFGQVPHAVTTTLASPFRTQLQLSDSQYGIETVIGTAIGAASFNNPQYFLNGTQRWGVVWVPLKGMP
jgi:hypothetical protein